MKNKDFNVYKSTSGFTLTEGFEETDKDFQKGILETGLSIVKLIEALCEECKKETSQVTIFIDKDTINEDESGAIINGLNEYENVRLIQL